MGEIKTTYEKYVQGLPPFLAAFAEPQRDNHYTPENQAVWRFIMRQLKHFLQDKAPGSYLAGLELAAISVDRIPRIEEMVASLEQIGWGAICVNGFIPPAAFMEYNANRILPISADMRTLKHLLYTPAPDIVHEAAGHAPILADPEYADFLERVGAYGSKALSNQYDQLVYESIRKLSIVKEYPHSIPEQMNRAQEELDVAIKQRAAHPSSEAALFSRFHWWTVEYGVMKPFGQKAEMKIFGAGLLSSLGEGRSCLSKEVKKIELSLDCVKMDYDITTKQPQLFYIESFRDLFPVLEKLADGMAFRLGGAESVERAIACECLATGIYDSGLQVSGIWTKCIRGKKGGEAVYIGTTGPTSLSYKNLEIAGHGESYHAHGFSSPVGNLKRSKTPLKDLTERDLFHLGIVLGEKSRLEFTSGVVVEGKLKKIMSRHGQNILMTFTDCLVSGVEGEVLFHPEWGTYDMAVGGSLLSVFGGPADKNNYDFIKKKSAHDNIVVSYTKEEQEVFDIYDHLRSMREREEQVFSLKQLSAIYEMTKRLTPNNWLLFIEMMELLKKNENSSDDHWRQLEGKIMKELDRLKESDSKIKYLIELGLNLCLQ